MAYSTVDQLKANEKELMNSGSAPDIDTIGLHRIAQADSEIEMELDNIVDFTSMPDYPTCPTWLNLLSQWKSAELTLAYFYSAKRQVIETNDITYYQERYNKLKKALFSGRISLGTYDKGVVTYQDYAKPEVEPALGLSDYGEFETLDELQTERPTDD